MHIAIAQHRAHAPFFGVQARVGSRNHDAFRDRSQFEREVHFKVLGKVQDHIRLYTAFESHYLGYKFVSADRQQRQSVVTRLVAGGDMNPSGALFGRGHLSMRDRRSAGLVDAA